MSVEKQQSGLVLQIGSEAHVKSNFLAESRRNTNTVAETTFSTARFVKLSAIANFLIDSRLLYHEYNLFHGNCQHFCKILYKKFTKIELQYKTVMDTS